MIGAGLRWKPAQTYTPRGFRGISAEMTSTLPPDYRPSEKEPFMNDTMQEYFRQKLLAWKDELLRDTDTTLQHLQEDTSKAADLSDRASAELASTVLATTAEATLSCVARR